MNVDKIELSKKIGQLKNVVPKQTTIPALQGILCKNGYLIASNNELTVKAKLDGIEDESFIIPMKAFELINSLPSGDVSVACKNDVVTIQMGKIKNTFKTYSPDKFTYARESIDDTGSASVDAMKLKEAMSHVLYAIPTSTGNPIMGGMYLDSENGNLNFVGLDGHRISWDCIPFEENFKLIVPRAAIEKVLSLDLQGDIHIAYDENGAIFKTEEYEIYTRLITGDYFAYQKMFSEGNIQTFVERRVFMDAINRARLCGAESDKAPVKLLLKENTLEIVYKNAMADYDEEIQIQNTTGEELKIAFDPKLLLDCLKSFSCDNLSISFSGQKMPAVIKAEDSDMTALVLPVAFREE